MITLKEKLWTGGIVSAVCVALMVFMAAAHEPVECQCESQLTLTATEHFKAIRESFPDLPKPQFYEFTDRFLPWDEPQGYSVEEANERLRVSIHPGEPQVAETILGPGVVVWVHVSRLTADPWPDAINFRLMENRLNWRTAGLEWSDGRARTGVWRLPKEDGEFLYAGHSVNISFTSLSEMERSSLNGEDSVFVAMVMVREDYPVW